MKKLRLELFYFYRNIGFARNADLAQTAAIGIKTKMGVDKLPCFKVNIMLALALIVPIFRNGTNRTTIDAFAADSF